MYKLHYNTNGKFYEYSFTEYSEAVKKFDHIIRADSDQAVFININTKLKMYINNELIKKIKIKSILK